MELIARINLHRILTVVGSPRLELVNLIRASMQRHNLLLKSSVLSLICFAASP